MASAATPGRREVRDGGVGGGGGGEHAHEMVGRVAQEPAAGARGVRCRGGGVRPGGGGSVVGHGTEGYRHRPPRASRRGAARPRVSKRAAGRSRAAAVQSAPDASHPHLPRPRGHDPAPARGPRGDAPVPRRRLREPVLGARPGPGRPQRPRRGPRVGCGRPRRGSPRDRPHLGWHGGQQPGRQGCRMGRQGARQPPRREHGRAPRGGPHGGAPGEVGLRGRLGAGRCRRAGGSRRPRRRSSTNGPCWSR